DRVGAGADHRGKNTEGTEKSGEQKTEERGALDGFGRLAGEEKHWKSKAKNGGRRWRRCIWRIERRWGRGSGVRCRTGLEIGGWSTGICERAWGWWTRITGHT